MIRDAQVVMLSEAVHCAAEPLEFRNRLFQYLVQEHGFTAIAIESGLVESRIVHDFVLGGTGDLDSVLAQGISWTFDRLPQNRDLVEWLKTYNAGRSRNINFYGFDMPGSPGNTAVSRGIHTALTEALRYLEAVDETRAALFYARIAPFIGSLHFDVQRPAHRPGYDQLDHQERDALTATVADLVALIERKEVQYTAVSGVVDYHWAHRYAVGARHVDAWLRQIPAGWQPLSEIPQRLDDRIAFLANEVRDRAQAENIQWILEREGRMGRILVYAARCHLSTTQVRSDFTEHNFAVAGTYLKRSMGSSVVSIGNLVRQGEAGCGEYRHRVGRAPPESMDAIAGEVGVPSYLLDLSLAPDPVKRWLDQEHLLVLADTQVLKLSVRRAFDILFYIDTVSPACV